MPAATASSPFVSPTGVSQFVDVDPQALRKNGGGKQVDADADANVNHASFLRWAECPVGMDTEDDAVVVKSPKSTKNSFLKSPKKSGKSSSSNSKKSAAAAAAAVTAAVTAAAASDGSTATKLKKTKTTTKTTTTTTKTKKKKKKSATIPTITTPTTITLSPQAQQLQQWQSRLDWLHDPHRPTKDRQDYQDQLQTAKASLRKALARQYAPEMQLASETTQKYNGRVGETAKVIQFLREDNARAREELHYLAKQAIAAQQRANDELEVATASAQASYDALREHVEGLEQGHTKLTQNCAVFKEAVKKMKRDYTKRTKFYQMECTTVHKYEMCLAKTLVQLGRVKGSGGPNLVEEVFQMAEEGVVEVIQGREESLNKAGLTIDEAQRKQALKLLMPQAMLDDEAAKTQGGVSDSDSDSDSDEEDSG